jgi:hypothetical protein
LRFLGEIKRYSSTLTDENKQLVLAMIRKMASVAAARKTPVRRVSF